MDRAEKAIALKHSGNNCAQAVLLSFQDMTGLDEDTLMALGAPFGAGMGSLKATCGALCGAQMVLGLEEFGKRSVMADAKKLGKDFEALCGSTYCYELKGVKTGKMLCSCDDCVKNAVTLLEQICEGT